MRICTWNVNGLRAALRKGFADHLKQINPDVLLLQEIRVLPEQLDPEWSNPDGWHVVWNPAKKKGYAGTAILSRHPIEVIETGILKTDLEGRVIRARINNVQVASVYLPSGSSSPQRQEVKERFMKNFFRWSRTLCNCDEPVIIGGDLNIAHTERDIFYAKSNETSSGFLPHERRWFSRFLNLGWTDFIRHQAGPIDGPYSWWSNRGQARVLDRGWRIDYLLGNDAAASKFQTATTHRDGGLSVSDHAPVFIDLG